MDFDDLRLFLHLSRTLHFGRTSQECHISASALSRSIQRLEQSVGQQLFERDNRSVELTRAGALLPYTVAGLAPWKPFFRPFPAALERARATHARARRASIRARKRASDVASRASWRAVPRLSPCGAARY